jgi:hypothetical protein
MANKFKQLQVTFTAFNNDMMNNGDWFGIGLHPTQPFLHRLCGFASLRIKG